MNADIKKFLESGLLELYLIGETTLAERRQVERYLTDSEEVRKVYDDLQFAIEQMAKEHASSPPPVMRSQVLGRVKALEPAVPNEIPQLKKTNYWAIAATVAALIFSGMAMFFYAEMTNFKNEKTAAEAKVGRLQANFDEQQAACQDLEEKFNLLAHPDTRSYILEGNENAPRFEIIAFWNETEQRSLVNLAALPDLPERQCFQIWADVDGEMLSLGILAANESNLQKLKYLPKATSLNVTIEPEGGSEHPNVANLVANVVI